MKFILESPTEEKILTFEDVKVNQFFVTEYGELCQKIDSMSYSLIAQSDGTLYADHCSNSYGFIIKRILPKVVKIEF